ncbi:uncharacterized protein LOC116603592 [Nematostella vectensis]|uniref:uncharacterized protein LOC116603592 n=1 Tax=Nematostella vectensis TaxID=45351 RepID=UPI0020773439|nr:uncharacterized protein LOC116603592 [Nematostella vectensis]
MAPKAGIFMFVCLMVGAFSQVSSLQCYLCTSSVSFAHCDARRTGVRCIGSTQCVSGYVIIHNVGKAFIRSCASRCDFNNVTMCRDGRDARGNRVMCSASCCHGDFCNRGSLPVTRPPFPYTTRSPFPSIPPSRNTIHPLLNDAIMLIKSLIETFKSLLRIVEQVIKIGGNVAAIRFKRDITYHMAQIDHHVARVPNFLTEEPGDVLTRLVRRDYIHSRMRANKLLQMIESAEKPSE